LGNKVKNIIKFVGKYYFSKNIESRIITVYNLYIYYNSILKAIKLWIGFKTEI